MLTREENSSLFDDICNCLRIDINSNVLSDAILAKITSLKLTKVDSLKGLEKLTNLINLEIVGQEDSTNIFEYKKIYQRNRNNHDFDMQNVFMYYYGEYTKNQIKEEDLKYIYKLTNLRYLNLARQRNIVSIDLSSFSRLKNLVLTESMHLKEIKGIENLIILSSDPKELVIDLAGCYRLKEINNIKVLINSLKRVPKDSKSKIYFPTIYFDKLYKLLKDEMKNLNCFNWSELCPGYRSDISDSNMLIAYELARDIVEECSKLAEDKMDKVSNIYKWICNNISYDYDGLRMNETAALYETRSKYDKVIRSSFTTLYYKKGVCVGVSGLFNYLCSLVDVVALPAYCSTKQIDFRRAILGNHQISKIYLNKIAYYFDPTFDLDAIEFEFFGKNKKEISDTHFLAVGEYNEATGKSIQNILRVNGYTKNNKGRAVGEFKKTRGSRR